MFPGLVGRAFDRQIYVIPSNPLDELFISNILNDHDDTKDSIDVTRKTDYDNNDNNDNHNNFIGQGILSLVDDVTSSSSFIDMKKYFQNSQRYAHIISPNLPPITLQYPDPYARNVDPRSYTTKTKIKSPRSGVKPGVLVGVSSGEGELRSQVKRILISSILPVDNR